MHMSYMSEKVIKELQQYIAERYPDGPQSIGEMNRIADEFMSQHYGGIRDSSQEVIPVDVYDYLQLAEQDGRKGEKRKYLAKAAELDPTNADVKLAQAKLESKSPLDLVETLPALIQAEEKRLKDEGIYNRSKGDFWMVIETRPYMRLLSEYVFNLTRCGLHTKAIQVGEEMLRLNCNDNLGIRFSMMALCAGTCNEKKALRLYKQYKNEKDRAFFLLPLALLYFKIDNWPKAKSVLETLKQHYGGTKKFFRSLKRRDMKFIVENYNDYSYTPGTDSELVNAYMAYDSIYDKDPYFFDWSDEALIVHRKPKKKSL